ncbi:MAG TPA: HlyD family efflux transporter periplasmic adaptor subunit [Vicinamibacteria bacterium]|nr:HlyD family efflux transporter periplasmic adaptor subunit [Vicinamibacteria bacterium]
MDRPRQDVQRRKNMRRLALAGGIVAALAVTLGLTRLRPAAPVVERGSVWIDTVKRGPMLRQVRGLGSLVPEEVRWVPAPAEARVERILVQAGATVSADTVLMELSNADLELAALDAETQARAAEAQYAETQAQLESLQLEREATAARVQAEYEQARLRSDTDAELAKEGLVADLTLKLSQVTARELSNRHALELRRVTAASAAARAQLKALRALVEQRRAEARLRRSQARSLQITPGLAGVVQQVPVEVGQRVAAGAVLARVAEPTHLKAVLRVAETQAKDVVVGQPVSVDTRNGVVPGKVARIDPAVQNGTVTVDVTLAGALPPGARPDLTVDGTIELERLADVVFVGRAAQAQPDTAFSLFRLEEDGATARRVSVRLGRASVSTIEVRDGLQPGQQVILSDTSAWDGVDAVRLR